MEKFRRVLDKCVSSKVVLNTHPQVLFVIGENATQCRSDDVEDMRAKMKVSFATIWSYLDI